METRKTYGEWFTKPSLTKEESLKVHEFEQYIEASKKYAPFTSEFNREVVATYEQEIEFLRGLSESEKNANINERIQVGDKLADVVSLEEQRQIKASQEKKKAEALQLKLDRRAGYTNASILIFVICNLGLFLALVLLMLK